MTNIISNHATTEKNITNLITDVIKGTSKSVSNCRATVECLECVVGIFQEKRSEMTNIKIQKLNTNRTNLITDEAKAPSKSVNNCRATVECLECVVGILTE